MTRAIRNVAMLLALVLLFTPLAGGQQQAVVQPKVIVLFDVSSSMRTIDGPEQPGREPHTLPTRLDGVAAFLKAVPKGKTRTFLDEVLAKAPVTAYRFGTTPDHLDAVHLEAGKNWTGDQWARWLHGDSKLSNLRNGTDIAGSALEMLEAERNSAVQAIVIVSDGRETQVNAEKVAEFLDAVRTPGREIPVFTVGVGSEAVLPRMHLHEPQAPRIVRPTDPFVVRVPLEARGLDGAAFQVVLEAERIRDVTGKNVSREKLYAPGPRAGKLQSGLQFVDFEIDARALKEPGTWRFAARMAKHPREPFVGKEHVSEPCEVVVQDRKLRVLLFTGGFTREYQFLRTMFYREYLENRLDVQNLPQTGLENVSDVDEATTLKAFPDKLDANAGDRMNLNAYDVIVALDPDWSKIDEKRQALLREWVEKHGGSIVFAAGPVHTYQLSRSQAYQLMPLMPLLPVVLKDSRLHALALTVHDGSKPHALTFGPTVKQYPFMKLTEGESPTAGWDEFFWGGKAKRDKPVRGIYTYYPVERLKPASEVVAVFAGPKESRIGDMTDAFKDQQPYFVRMAVGAGSTWYLGSQETWRLRQFRDDFQTRFWLGLIQHTAAAGRGLVQRHGQILMPRETLIGSVPIDARILDKDAKPLPRDAAPKAEVRRMDKTGEATPLELQGQAPGRFTGVVKLETTGDYLVRVAIPGSSETLTRRVHVRRLDREADDVRPDFRALALLASEAAPLLKKAHAPRRAALEAVLDSAAKPLKLEERRLYFPLTEAYLIPDLLEKLPASKVEQRPPRKIKPPTKSAKDGQPKEVKPIKVLVIDGEGADGRKEGDSFYVNAAIRSFTKGPYRPVFGDEVARGDAAKALETEKLADYGAVLLLNVKDLTAKQLAALEAFSKNGGGVGVFLGPRVDVDYYNQHLYKAGKGVFPVPLQKPYYPGPKAPPLEYDLNSRSLLREDLLRPGERLPIFGLLFPMPKQARFFEELPVHRYFKIARADWNRKDNRAVELVSLANTESVARFEKQVAELTRGSLRKLLADAAFAKFRPALQKHIDAIERVGLPGSPAKACELAVVLDGLIADRALFDLWKNAKSREVFTQLVTLSQQARYGDPLIIAGEHGKGRTIAFLSTAGKAWNDFPGGSAASIWYAPFIIEMLDHLTHNETSDERGEEPPDRGKQGPEIIDFAPELEPRRVVDKNKKLVPDKAPVYLITPNAMVPFRGTLWDVMALTKAEWVVQIGPDKDGTRPPELRVPLEALTLQQHESAIDEAKRNVLLGIKDATFPTGYARVHSLSREAGFDFRKHLPALQQKGEPHQPHLVKLWLEVHGGKDGKTVTRTPPTLFVIGSENEVVAQTGVAAEEMLVRLDDVFDRLRDADARLAELAKRLDDPNLNRETFALRLDEVAGSLETIRLKDRTTFARKLALHLAINRVQSDAHKRMRGIADDAESAQQKAPGIAFFLHRTAGGAGKANVADLRRDLDEARKQLKALENDVRAHGEHLQLYVTELKLIAILLQIERQQAELQRERERIERQILEELLKKK